jgi:hypothetical protein
MRARTLLLAVLCGAAPAEVLDRIAVTVGQRVITDSDVRREIRLSAWMNAAPPDFSPASRRRAAERLVERALAQTEMEIGKYPAPAAAETEAQLAELQKERFPQPGALERALDAAGLTAAELRGYLSEQLAVLRFIDARFGPAVLIGEEELQSYYAGAFTQQWKAEGGQPVPPFEEVRGEIGDILRAAHIDRLLDAWLKEAKARARIVYVEEAFQ